MIKQERKASSMMHRQVKRYAFAAVMVVAIAVSGSCSGNSAKKPKGPITAATFPDATFSAYVMEKFDEDEDGIISDEEVADAEVIRINREGVTSLEGIAVFSNLKVLDCAENKLTSLDLSFNTALTELQCQQNPLTKLDVSKTALKKLVCYNTQLTTLDVSNNTALFYLSCGDNLLTALDVSKNTALTYLACRDNKLTTLDVSNNTALKEFWCKSDAPLKVILKTGQEIKDNEFDKKNITVEYK